MKTIKELLQITLDNFDELFDGKDGFTDGLCLVIIHLDITISERLILEKYLKLNLPPLKEYGMYGSYSWPPGEVEPRIKWLKEHIEIHNSKK